MRLLCASGLFSFLLCACSDRSEKYMENLSGIAESINSKCPRMLDSDTRLDGIEIKEPNTLVYRYTLIRLDASLVDTGAFYRALWPGIISHIKISPEMKILRNEHTVIEYTYNDKSGKHIYTFRATPELYN